MRIAVSSTGSTLDSQVDARFGRCAYFIIVDPDTMEYEAYPNEGSGFSSGAGTSAAQFVASKGVEYVITGNCGPKAMQVLSASGIKVILGQTGTVREVINKFKKGELSAAQMDTFGGGFGMGFGKGMGRGGGRGMGMGRGCGGGGYFSNSWDQVVASTQNSRSVSSNSDNEIKAMKEEINELKKGINLILERLERLERK